MEDKNIFKDKVVLIVGRPTEFYLQIIHSFLQADAFVIAPARSFRIIQKMKACKNNHRYQKLITEITDVPDYEKAAMLADTIIEKFGQIDIAISMFSFSPAYKTPLQLSCDDRFNMLDEDLNPFFVSALVALKAMKKEKAGLLVHITDSSQFEESVTELTMLALKTKLELSRIFANEAEQGGVNYYHLWVQNLKSVKTFPPHSDSPRISSEMVSEHIKRLHAKEPYDKANVFQLFPEIMLAS